MENLWLVNKNLLNSKDNLFKADFEYSLEEMKTVVRAGGGTIIDVTPKNVGGDPRRVGEISREPGISVVQGTSNYLKATHFDRIADASIDEIADEFVSDVQEGIDDTNIRAGIVGEIGTSYNPDSDSDILIHEDEKKLLRAGARSALRTGAPDDPPAGTQRHQPA
jgi:phosphotriesterase-related protein